MKKPILFLFLIIFLSYFSSPRLVFAQLLPKEMVPVIDENAVQALARIADVLDSLLTISTEEFQKLNVQIAHILDNQIKEEANKIFTDALKEMTYQEYVAELQKVIEKNEIKSVDDIQKDLEEAKVAGAYLGLEEFQKSVSCLNPRIKNEIFDYTANLVAEVDLEKTAREFLSQIPDCQVFSQPASAKQSQISFNLFSPFNLSSFMAQLKTPQLPSEPPVLSIVPAFQETEDSIEFSEIKNILNASILGKITEKTEERKKELAEVRPLYETCLRDAFTDGGRAICLDKKTVIGLTDLKKSLENVPNPLSQSLENYNIYQQLASSQNVFTKLGLATSSLTTSTDFFYSTSTIKKIIDENCADYSKDKSIDKIGSAYLRCLKIYNDKLTTLTKIQQTKLENIKGQMEKTKDKLEILKNEAEAMKNELSGCPAAYNDLEEIIKLLGGQFDFYSKLYSQIFSEIDGFSNRLLEIINEIRNLNSQIERLLDQFFSLDYEIVSFLNESLNNFKSIQKIGKLLGLNLNESIIKDLLVKFRQSKENKFNQMEKPEELKEIKGLENGVRKFISKINKTLDKISDAIYKFNSFYVDLNRSDISRSVILDDFYKAEELNQKLQAYKRLVRNGKCSLEKENLSAQQKPKIIVVESKEKRGFKFSWLKNLVGSRLVEINFKK